MRPLHHAILLRAMRLDPLMAQAVLLQHHLELPRHVAAAVVRADRRFRTRQAILSFGQRVDRGLRRPAHRHAIHAQEQLMMHHVTRILVHEAHEKVGLLTHQHVHQIRRPDLIGTRRLLFLQATTLRTPTPRTHQVRFLENPVHRRWAQAGHVLIHHPPGQLAMTQLRMTSRILQHRLLLLWQRLVGLHRTHRTHRRLGQLTRPLLLLEPAVIAPTRDAQDRQGLLRRPAAALTRLHHRGMHFHLQRRRQLTMILYSESPFCSSRFSVVISAITRSSR